MSDCPLCHTPLDDDRVPFGIFEAHRGCHDDFYRDYSESEER